MHTYLHHVHYYETDKMGITHHSNYIRWMEESRVDFMDKIGWGYAKMESEGIISPVIGIECEYKHSTTFDDQIEIKVGVAEYKGIRLTMKYEMRNTATGALVFTGTSKHCFLGANGKPIRLAKEAPEFNQLMKDLLEEDKLEEKDS